MNIFKYAQSHIIVLHQHVSVTPLTVVMEYDNKNTINVQITVQDCLITPRDSALYFSVAFFMVIKYRNILSLKHSKIACVSVVCV
jgi:hypothetical protein